MKTFVSMHAIILALSAGAGLAEITKGISEGAYSRMVEMATISQAAYANLCNLPSTITSAGKIYNAETDINGWVLRDDSRQEIITVFRGTGSEKNLQLDTNYTQAPFDTLPQCSECAVHGGYYVGWISVKDQVEYLIQQQASQYPDYSLVITGHSLGASMAAISAAQLSATYNNITVYTFGEPRTGNQAFASYVDETFQATSPDATKFYRVTHTNDGIPNVPPTWQGYVHHGTEYWSVEPHGPQNMFLCLGDEVQCCEAQGGQGINDAHVTYFGMASGSCRW